MTLRYPDYFCDFVCTGSGCRDNCCKMGWDIEIDDDTLGYYREHGGELCERLCENIYEEDGAHYMSQEGGCPFLSAEGLCSVQQEMGAEHISEICREHPRFYEWFGDYKEAGLGLCCEDVSRIVMTHKRPVLFTEKQTDEAPDDLEFDMDIFTAVRNIRDRLIDIAQDRGFTILQRLALICWCTEDINEALLDEDTERLKKISGMLAIDGFRMEIAIQAENEALTQAEDKPALLMRLFSVFERMEYMGSFGDRFALTRADAEKMLGAEKGFNKEYTDLQYELENILVYFLYRYFIKCTRDFSAEERLYSAVYMTLAVRGIFLREYAENGALPDKENRIELVKDFSKEVEYDADNTDMIFEDIQQYDDVRDMLCGLCF